MKYTKGRMELKRTTIELKHLIEVFNSRQDRERKTSENSLPSGSFPYIMPSAYEADTDHLEATGRKKWRFIYIIKDVKITNIIITYIE